MVSQTVDLPADLKNCDPQFQLRIKLHGPQEQWVGYFKSEFGASFEVLPPGISLTPCQVKLAAPTQDKLKASRDALDSLFASCTSWYTKWKSRQSSAGTGPETVSRELDLARISAPAPPTDTNIVIPASDNLTQAMVNGPDGAYISYIREKTGAQVVTETLANGDVNVKINGDAKQVTDAAGAVNDLRATLIQPQQ